ncbi:MAG: Lrp/AsnC family transcriptional regulator [Candidatus Micrarchaeaceae archaeon]
MEVPEQVKKTFERLKLEYPFYIVLVKTNDRFYVYKSRSFRDKESKKVHVERKYLGRIIEKDGAFIKKKSYPTMEALSQPQRLPWEVDEIDEKILMHLSMNCRIPLKVIAERVGLSVSAIEYRKRRLEKKLGIRYLASLNVVKLGFFEFLVFVKFINSKPSIEEVVQVLENEPRVQLVITAQGEYDLLIYILAENENILSDTIYKIRNDKRLSDYESIWNVIISRESYGYVPLRDKFFDLIEEKVWHRSKETPRPTGDSLTQREYILLKELNANGDIPFADIDKKYNLGNGSAEYTFEKLKEKGFISRETLTMRTCGVKYNAAVIVERINEALFLKDREKFIRFIIKDQKGAMNRFSYVGDVAAPDGELFILPVLKDGELEEETEWLSKQIGGIKVKALIFTGVIVGELCYRKIDNNHSSQMRTLISEYKAEAPKLIDYMTE